MSFFLWFIYLVGIVGNAGMCILNWSVQDYFWSIINGVLTLGLIAFLLDDLKDNDWRLL